MNGLKELLLTQGMLLAFFILLFSFYLEPESSVSELIEHQMVTDPTSIDNPVFQVYRNNTAAIFIVLLGLPFAVLVALKIKNQLQRRREVNQKVKQFSKS